MTPILVQVDGYGKALLIAFGTLPEGPIGIIVWPSGAMDWAKLTDIRVERPTTEFPIGEGPWSRVQSELAEAGIDS